MKNNNIVNHYYVKDGKITPKIDIKGDIPDGNIFVDSDCRVTFDMYNKNYKGTKKSVEEKTEIIKNDGTTQNYLIGKIKEDNEILKPPLSKPGNEVILSSESSLVENEDDIGETLYFRGNVQNNYVKLGVNPKTIWYNSTTSKYYDTED